MKQAVLVSAIAACVLFIGVAPGAQDKAAQMKEYSRVLPGLDVTLTLMHLNDLTAPLVFQPPTMYAMRSRARESTVFYVQGRPAKDIDIDTTNFRIEQGGEKATAEPSNIKNFAKGNKIRVPLGGQIDGLLVFPKVFDVSKAFTIRHDRDLVEFKFNAAQVKAMTVAPTQQ